MLKINRQVRKKRRYPKTSTSYCVGCGQPMQMQRVGSGRLYPGVWGQHGCRDYHYQPIDDHESTCPEAKKAREVLKAFSGEISSRLNAALFPAPTEKT